MKSILKNIGLTPNETLVYESLVKLGGSSSAGEIIKLADIHRNIVYDALTHLKNRNLVQIVTKNKKQFFTLKNPDHLVSGFEKQIQNTQELSKILSGLPNMSSHETTVYEGSVAWQTAWQDAMASIQPGSTFYTIGMAGDKWVKLMGETFVEYEQWALENKITDKIVSQKHLQGEIEAHQNIKFRDIRYIAMELPSHVSIEIFSDRIFFEVYDGPQTLIEIKSKAMVARLKAYFGLRWAMGK